MGHSTIIRGEGPLRPGKGPVRTGVTAILPNAGQHLHGARSIGGGFVLNGAGEVSGLTQVMEWGLIETPILLTNTMSVGAVSDAVARYMVEQLPGHRRRARRDHPGGGRVRRLLAQRHRRPPRAATSTCARRCRRRPSGPVAEGSVGGGTGMMTCDFKAGIGTSLAQAARGRSAATPSASW